MFRGGKVYTELKFFWSVYTWSKAMCHKKKYTHTKKNHWRKLLFVMLAAYIRSYGVLLSIMIIVRLFDKISVLGSFKFICVTVHGGGGGVDLLLFPAIHCGLGGEDFVTSPAVSVWSHLGLLHYSIFHSPFFVLYLLLTVLAEGRYNRVTWLQVHACFVFPINANYNT